MRTLFLALMGWSLCALAQSGNAPPPAAATAARSAANADDVRFLLTPALETTLASAAAGKIRAVNATLGQAVAKGKVLVSFDCDEQAARMRMAEAEFAAAQQTYETKIRLQGLDQAAEVEVALAASAAERARAQISLYRAQADQCSVAAPFSGRIVKVAVKPHQGVTPGQPLIEMVSDGPLKLRLNAPAKWLAWLKTGTRFEVAIDETGKSYKARVSAVNGRVDAVSQSIELEAAIDEKAPDLLPGMSGVARFAPPR